MGEIVKINHYLKKTDSYSMEYGPEEILYKENMPIDSLYFIEEGLVKVVEESISQQSVTQLIGKGNFLGLTDLLTERFYSQTVYCVDNVRVRLYESKELRNYLLQNTDIARSVIQSIKMQDLLRLENYIHLLKYPVENRVIRFIVWLMKDVYSSEEFMLKMDRAEIAAYLSTSTKTLNRILKQLKQDRLLSFYSKKMKILDSSRLFDLQ